MLYFELVHGSIAVISTLLQTIAAECIVLITFVRLTSSSSHLSLTHTCLSHPLYYKKHFINHYKKTEGLTHTCTTKYNEK